MSGAIPPPPIPPPPGPDPSGVTHGAAGGRALWVGLAVVGPLLLLLGVILVRHLADNRGVATSPRPISSPSPSAGRAGPPLGAFSGHRVQGFPNGWRRWALTDGALSIVAPPNTALSGGSVESQSATFQGDDGMWFQVLTVISANYRSVSEATANFPSSLGQPERIRVNGVMGLAYSSRSSGRQFETWVFVIDGNFYELQGSYPFGSPTSATANHEVRLYLGSLALVASPGN